MALVGPPPLLDRNPLRRGAAGTCATSARRPFRSRRGKRASRSRARGASPTNRCRCCSSAYERYGPIFTLRLFHGNVVFMLGPGRQPLHHSSPTPSNFTWREGALPRPDRADGRRAADDRRRLPPPLAADHAAGVPPRAARRVGRRRSSRRPTRALEQLSRGRRASTCTRGRAGSRCGSRCARCSASTPTASARARSTPPACSSRRSSFYSTDVLPARAARPAHAVGAHAAGRAHARHADLRGDLRAPRHRRARRGHPQPAARRAGRGRQHAQRPADPRRGDDADVRRATTRRPRRSSFMFYELARHPEIVARLQRRAGRRSSRTARPTRHAADVRRARRARDGARRDAAQVPARVGRAAALGRAVRVRRPHRPRRARSSTTARGPRTTCPTCSRPGGVPARALHARGARPRCPRAPTCPSAAARARASGCASASSRCARSRR